MEKKLGPTFGAEMAAAGLTGLPISWSEDGSINGRDSLSEEQNILLDAVVASHDPARSVLRAHLPARRWEAETAGTTWNGWRLPTDKDSRSNYLAELAAVNEGLRVDGQPWKFPHGFEALTNEQVKAMVAAARAHVLACFAKEAEIYVAIGEGTITATAEIDALFEALS